MSFVLVFDVLVLKHISKNALLELSLKMFDQICHTQDRFFMRHIFFDFTILVKLLFTRFQVNSNILYGRYWYSILFRAVSWYSHSLSSCKRKIIFGKPRWRVLIKSLILILLLIFWQFVDTAHSFKLLFFLIKIT